MSIHPPSSTPQGNQFEISHFLASVKVCNLIWHIHVVLNWQLSKQGFHWPVTHDRIMGSLLEIEAIFGTRWVWLLKSKWLINCGVHSGHFTELTLNGAHSLWGKLNFFPGLTWRGLSSYGLKTLASAVDTVDHVNDKPFALTASWTSDESSADSSDGPALTVSRNWTSSS